MKKCLVCNTENRDDAVTCEKCGAPLPETNTPGAPAARKKSKAPMIIGIVLALAAIGAAVWFFACRGKGDSKSLVRGMPKGMSIVGGINVQPILDLPIVKEQLAKPEITKSIDQAKSFSGVDLLATKGVSFGLQIKDNTVHVLMVAKGSFNVEHMRTILKMVGPAKEVKGTPMVSFDLGKMMPRRMPRAAYRNLEVKKDEGDEDSGDSAEGSDSGEGKAEIAEPKEEPFTEFPSFASVVLGPVDDSTFIAGSEAMVEAYLAGGETLGDDKEMGPLFDKISSDAIYWGIGRMKKDSPEGKLIAQMAAAMSGPMGSLVSDMLMDAVGWFEVGYKDAVVMRGATILASEEAAKAAKEKVDAMMADPMVAGVYEKLGTKPTLKLDGKEISFELSFKLPDFAKLGGL